MVLYTHLKSSPCRRHVVCGLINMISHSMLHHLLPTSSMCLWPPMTTSFHSRVKDEVFTSSRGCLRKKLEKFLNYFYSIIIIVIFTPNKQPTFLYYIIMFFFPRKLSQHNEYLEGKKICTRGVLLKFKWTFCVFFASLTIKKI
jgi:hypothetical protein